MRDMLQKKDEQLTVLRAQSEELQSTNGEYMYYSVPEYVPIGAWNSQAKSRGWALTQNTTVCSYDRNGCAVHAYKGVSNVHVHVLLLHTHACT